MLELGAQHALDSQYTHYYHKLTEHQHRLESILADGAALLNPRCFWCGWCQQVLILKKMPTATTRQFFEQILRHWRQPSHVFDSVGVGKATQMLEGLLADEGSLDFPYAFSRQEMHKFLDDPEVCQQRLQSNDVAPNMLDKYKSTKEALVDGSLESA